MELVPSRAAWSAARPDRDAIGETAAYLAGAERPVLIVGDRVGEDDGVAEAVRVAELMGARVYSHLGSQVNFPTGHPQFMGNFVPRNQASRQAVQAADVVLAVGTHVFSDLFYQPGALLPASATLIHLDSDAAALGRSEPTHLAILAAPKLGLAELGAALGVCMSRAERQAARDQMQCYRGGDGRAGEAVPAASGRRARPAADGCRHHDERYRRSPPG